jgi:lysine-specific demethylase 8
MSEPAPLSAPAPPRLPIEAIEAIAAPAGAELARHYVAPRRPVLLRGLAAAWPATAGWSLESLQQRYAATPVRTFGTERGRVRMDAPSGAVEGTARLGDFLAGLRSGATGDTYLTTPWAALPAPLRAEAPTPTYCAAAPWQSGNLWIGAAGTVAPLHRDLADNLHVVVRGAKRLTLVSPSHSTRLSPNGLLDPFPNGCRVDPEQPDLEAFPRLRGVTLLRADLAPGDALYIPRRWWHHVRTLETSIAVNFWWATGRRRALVVAAEQFKRWRGLNR